jgi:hypothetical protein
MDRLRVILCHSAAALVPQPGLELRIMIANCRTP